MPRPKVKPQDRQRSVRACDACKASKKRCDANQPCRLCLKKGAQDTCTYTPTARDKRSRPSVQQSDTASTAAGSHPKTISSVAVENSPTDFRSILTGSTQLPRHHFHERVFSEQQDDDAPDADEDVGSETEENPESRNSVERSTQKPVMLSSSSGDKGMASSLLPVLCFGERHLHCSCAMCLPNRDTTTTKCRDKSSLPSLYAQSLSVTQPHCPFCVFCRGH